MKVIYVAGPFRGLHAWAVENNVRNAEGVAFHLFAAGFSALCPHTGTRFFDGSLADQILTDATLELLRRCDAIFILPGWEKSSGTKRELEEAARLRIPAVFIRSLQECDIRMAIEDLKLQLTA